MSQQITVLDDLDGTPGAVERHYSVAGIEYEIDLHDDHWAEFLSSIERFRSYSRVASKKRTRENSVPTMSPEERSAIRAWAIVNGRHIPSRGRFPNDIIRDYRASMAKNPAHNTFV